MAMQSQSVCNSQRKLLSPRIDKLQCCLVVYHHHKVSNTLKERFYHSESDEMFFSQVYVSYVIPDYSLLSVHAIIPCLRKGEV